MATTPCPSCSQPMHEAAVVCPHCNARRPGVTTGLKGKSVSNEEMRAILAVEVPPPDTSQGLFATVLLPHDSTTGGARVLEIVLTIVALPMVLGAALSIMFMGRRSARQLKSTSGEWAPAFVAALLGGLAGWGLVGWPITAVSVAALFARAYIRDRNYTSRSDELHRLERKKR